MNLIAYRTTSLAIKTLSNLSKARVYLHGMENIPQGPTIFVMNHFTRLETFLMPYYMHKLTRKPIWSLAASELFVGAFGRYLESVGAVSTENPDRDRLIIKNLLTNKAAWIIFPEGRMVKSKKIIEKGRYIVSYDGGKHPPHTGAAYMAMRTEFYRQRLLQLQHQTPEEIERLLPKFNLSSIDEICNQGTCIVPVNITYYPMRARENILNKLAKKIVEELPERVTEELMTEGSMLISGVDIDIRFGEPLEIAPFMKGHVIQKDIHTSHSFDPDDPLPCIPDMHKAALKLTRKYMGAIYSMTMVNHEHIFASLLKYGPVNRIRFGNWRRRAFLSIVNNAKKADIHFHRDLGECQNHLLVDDCFGKVSNFVSLAEEKGVIVQEPPFLLLDRRKISGIFNFHRVRIDNPIAVIANEVEPLTGLQRQISLLSWIPGFWLRAKVAGYLRREAEKAFDSDYAKYHIHGESKPKKIGRPFLIKGRSRNLGIVLCHGYMAAPEEVRGLAEYLGRLGYWVYVPRLAGHGTAPEDLARCTYHEWIRSMEEGYLIIHNLCRNVVLGGFSTGAALALELASRLTDLAGVFSISAPLRLKDMGAHLAPVVDTWNRLMKRVHLKDARKEFVENHPENRHINYTRNPISGVRELERLMDYVEPMIRRITIPALVVQSQKDPVVNAKGAEKIFKLLGSENKQYIVFNLKRHGILVGDGAENVYRVVGEFVQHLPLRRCRIKPTKNADDILTKENTVL